ncbi:hypothetical protein ElyMa_001092000 [Elysia marginata]|uniref:Uncharacterized protein n=1 Tax=Elysia marginata TaxID=1093978 RepID=A0AAV4HTS9_9GAST|nr:hypothetical protein ElyMa_001092000 [Elysia marginata]
MGIVVVVVVVVVVAVVEVAVVVVAAAVVVIKVVVVVAAVESKLIQEKANKSDLQGLGGVDVPEDLLNTLKNIQDELQALKDGQLRDTGPTDKTSLSLPVGIVDLDTPLSVSQFVNSAPGQPEVSPPKTPPLPACHSPVPNVLQGDMVPNPVSTQTRFNAFTFLPDKGGPRFSDSESISPEDLVCHAYPSPSPPPCLSTVPSSHSSNAISPVTPPLPNMAPRLLPPIGFNGDAQFPVEDPPPGPHPTSGSSGIRLQPPGSLTSFSPPPIRIESAMV